MYRKKSKEEICNQFYLCKRDIRTLFSIGEKRTNKIFSLAEEIDNEELGKYRIEPMKVRLTSVCKVTGISYNMLKKQIEKGNTK